MFELKPYKDSSGMYKQAWVFRGGLSLLSGIAVRLFQLLLFTTPNAVILRPLAGATAADCG